MSFLIQREGMISIDSVYIFLKRKQLLFKSQEILDMKIDTKLLYYIGLWPNFGRYNKTFFQKAAYNIYTAIVATLFMLFTLSSSLDGYFLWGDLANVTAALCVSFTNFTGVAKLFLMIFCRQKIESLVNKLELDLYITGCQLRKIETDFVIKASVRQTKILNVQYPVLCVLTFIFWLYTSPSTRKVEVTQLFANNCSNKTIVETIPILPYPGWFPYDHRVSPYYEISLTFQIVAGFVCTIFASGMDSFYVSLIIHTYTQFKLLSSTLKNITNTENIFVICKVNSHNTDCGGQHIECTNREGPDICKKWLIVCINYHNNILKYVKELQSVIGPIMIVECLMISLILCTIFYQATMVPIMSVRFMSILGFWIVEMLKLFMYCWAGNELMLQSSMVSQAAYESEWHTQTKEFKTLIKIVMCQAHVERKLTACHFATVSLQLFTMLLKASYSFYAVLNQL